MYLSQQALSAVIVLNLTASVAHCVDNMLFFPQYPEPPWITGPYTVELLFALVTLFLFLGWYLYYRGQVKIGVACLAIYAFASLSVLGHYLYAPMSALSFRVNLLVWLETGAAAALLISLPFQWQTSGDRMEIRMQSRGPPASLAPKYRG